MYKLAARALLTLLLLVLTGAVYERVEARKDRQRFPQIGRLVDIGGRSLDIYCSGEGNPSVVLIAGGGLPGYSWVLVQPGIARVTRACWYDRAGLGWSDAAPDTQTSLSAATDLHQLLHRAHVAPPYVLVGHSVGGFHARAFYRLYRSEVAGIVLVDASHEDYNARIHVGNPLCPKCPRRPAVLAATLLANVGVFRLLARDPGPAPEGMTRYDWATIASLQRQAKAVVSGGLKEDASASEEQMRTGGNLGDLPLIVLTGGRTFANAGADVENADAQSAWVSLQSELARLSTRGKQVIVKSSGHMMQYDASIEITRAVLEVVDVERGSFGTSRH
jgi:pimeloyl-ACP methyl ester carboxylesterase